MESSPTLSYIVQKFNLNLNRKQPLIIESIGRNGLAELFKELNFNLGAEIGVDSGVFSEILCKTNSSLHLFSIDPWSTNAYEDSFNSSPAMEPHFEKHYRSAVHRLSKHNCTVVRKQSLEAVHDFKDNSLDFVYIDSNHSFINIASDIYRWEKKVKVGGIVSGHDYEHFPPSQDNHVKHIVDAYAQAFEIPYYFELGQDRHHSWFWVKE